MCSSDLAHRASLEDLVVYPRPEREIPIWIAVGARRSSFAADDPDDEDRDRQIATARLNVRSEPFENLTVDSLVTASFDELDEETDSFTRYAVQGVTTAQWRPEDRPFVVTGALRTLTEQDDAFYQPYARDADGRPLDMVIDWAGVPRTSIRTQKGQAILMTLAANSVLINRRSDDYWDKIGRAHV